MPLIHLVYVSSGKQLFADAELLALLERSRRNNTVADITGLLLYRDGNFIQALEGEEPAVTITHERITRDPRHTGLITLLKEPITQRTFSDWAMGFQNLNSPEVHRIPGYSEFLNVDWSGRQMIESPDCVWRLLKLFRKNVP